ncbi:MAG: hypothetical protein ACRDJE_28185 [Dehalococcoidia bacterium]
MRAFPPNRRRFLSLAAALLGAALAARRSAPVAAKARLSAQGLLAVHRIVSFYGTPLAPGLGALGQGDPETMIGRLRAQADAYAALDPERTVQPALHLIYEIAQAAPGADGLYLGRTPDAIVEEYIRLARDNGLLLFLDLQLGRSTIEREVGAVARFLAEPNVHLALDPEFAWGPGVTPVEDIGFLRAAQVNQAQAMLQQIATENGLPGKILIVHQFRHGMLPDKAAIQPHEGVELVIDMDGFGSPAAKLDTYTAVITNDAVQYPGVKLFYEHDVPLMSPEDVLALWPRPVVVIYQ